MCSEVALTTSHTDLIECVLLRANVWPELSSYLDRKTILEFSSDQRIAKCEGVVVLVRNFLGNQRNGME
jgi:hypothetical protein